MDKRKWFVLVSKHSPDHAMAVYDEPPPEFKTIHVIPKSESLRREKVLVEALKDLVEACERIPANQNEHEVHHFHMVDARGNYLEPILKELGYE